MPTVILHLLLYEEIGAARAQETTGEPVVQRAQVRPQRRRKQLQQQARLCIACTRPGKSQVGRIA